MPHRLRALREHDGWWQLAYVMLMQATKEATAGDAPDRAWLVKSKMAEACFGIVGIECDVARVALRKKWSSDEPSDGSDEIERMDDSQQRLRVSNLFGDESYRRMPTDVGARVIQWQTLDE